MSKLKHDAKINEPVWSAGKNMRPELLRTGEAIPYDFKKTINIYI